MHLPFLSRYFYRIMPSSWLEVTCTSPPSNITMLLLFLSRYLCRSIRVRGLWDTPIFSTEGIWETQGICCASHEARGFNLFPTEWFSDLACLASWPLLMSIIIISSEPWPLCLRATWVTIWGISVMQVVAQKDLFWSRQGKMLTFGEVRKVRRATVSSRFARGTLGLWHCWPPSSPETPKN